MSRPKVVYLGLIIVFAIMFISVIWSVYNSSNPIEPTSEINYLDEDSAEASLFLLQYNGINGKGSSVIEVIQSILKIHEVSFGDQKQKYHWELNSKKNDDGIFYIDYHITSSNIDSTFQFIVDMNQKTVIGRNSVGMEVIKIVEAEGGESKQEIDPKTFCTKENEEFYKKLGMSEIFEESALKHCSQP